jgi:hypothetical protein
MSEQFIIRIIPVGAAMKQIDLRGDNCLSRHHQDPVQHLHKPMSSLKHEETLRYAFLQHVYTVQLLVKARDRPILSIPTFCVSTALFKLANASV